MVDLMHPFNVRVGVRGTGPISRHTNTVILDDVVPGSFAWRQGYGGSVNLAVVLLDFLLSLLALGADDSAEFPVSTCTGKS